MQQTYMCVLGCVCVCTHSAIKYIYLFLADIMSCQHNFSSIQFCDHRLWKVVKNLKLHGNKILKNIEISNKKYYKKKKFITLIKQVLNNLSKHTKI